MEKKLLVFLLASLLLLTAIGTAHSANLRQNQVSQLYVSIFGRASEGEGNTYWCATQTDITIAANTMLATGAAQSYFGNTLNDNQMFIEFIYENTLGKTYAEDPDGVNYWVGELTNGKSKGQVIATLINAAMDPQYTGLPAQDQFINRVTVCDYVANIIATCPDVNDLSAFVSFISNITHQNDTVMASQGMVDAFFIDTKVHAETCGAYVAPGVWKEFDCYNLAAIGKTTNDDPFTPSWRLNGGYWQWGRKGPDSSQWYDTNTTNFTHGPTGPGTGDANDGRISNRDTNDAPDDAWSDTFKTANDPCPVGYRVPTSSQWDGVLNNNTQSTVGSWSISATNYSSALFFGNDLMLPAAGLIPYFGAASLGYRGYFGHYWSSTYSSSSSVWGLDLYSSHRIINPRNRRSGYSVRCIEDEYTDQTVVWYKDADMDGYSNGETQLSVQDPGNGYYAEFSLASSLIDCNDNDPSIHPEAQETRGDGIDQDCNGSDLPYLITYYRDYDGDGYGEPNTSYESADKPSGYVANNTDCSDYDNTIHPGATEICGDGIDQDCNGSDLVCEIDPGGGGNSTCGAYVAPGVWKEFDCYNLAAIGKTTNDDPFMPTWRLIGGYWQFGRKGPDSSQWYDTNTAYFAHGPTGPGSGDANDGDISSWNNEYYAPSNAWSTISGSAIPCPVGYQLPSLTQWDGILNNNTQSTVGSWTNSATNYSSARFFGNDLMLPAAGYRDYHHGSLLDRGYRGNYWSGTKAVIYYSEARLMSFTIYEAMIPPRPLRSGFSVRCVAE